MTQISLLAIIIVAFAAALSPGAIDAAPPRGVVLSVHAVPDGTALVAWTTQAADYITHVRSDGAVLSAELASQRLDADVLDTLEPVWLWPTQRELPQFVGIDTTRGPIIIDLETLGVVWREDSDDRIVRDGTRLYVVGGGRVRAFDTLTFSMALIATGVEPEQIGGGFVWTYDKGESRIDAPVVHAIQPATPAPVTARR